MVSYSCRPVGTGPVDGAVPENVERELDRVLRAELVFRGPSLEGLKEVAIEAKTVEYDEAATRGDLGGHHAGVSAKPPRLLLAIELRIHGLVSYLLWLASDHRGVWERR